ncbi:MAG: DUF1802 family protein [Cyanobacteria bacterium P01_A01_bin.45]
MTNDIVIYKALYLPAPDIEALLQGRLIVAISNKFINRDKFALYSTDSLMNSLPVEKYYHSNFLHLAQTTFTELATKSFTIKAWAKCEWCHDINPESITNLSRLTIWTKETLEETLARRKTIFLAYLRVYHLSQPIQISLKGNNQFILLPKSITVSDTNPVLPDNIFTTRKGQLEKLEPPQHHDLEELLNFLSPLTVNNPRAKQLEKDIHLFLGWSNQKTIKYLDSDLTWIHKIAGVGNSSDGNEFERLVRKSFIKLGFSCSNSNPKANLDPDKVGGAGGVDFYCESPYPVVGECKATKSEKVPSSTPGQLIQLGKNHLQEKYDSCIKIILAGGELTKDALLTATNNQMNVITPETLEKLVKLQSYYQGCVNLIKLKQCLQQEPFGLADDKINIYIDKIEQDIKLRSHLIEIVKNHQENTGDKNIEVATIYGAYGYSNPPQSVNIQEMHEILIELSSPLTGYLGRIKGTDWKSDKFYFLRDLPTEFISHILNLSTSRTG